MNPTIIKIEDNIVTISGEVNYKQEQLFRFNEETIGVVISAKISEAKLLIIGDLSSLSVQDRAIPMNETLSYVDLYGSYFGKVISPFGDSVFGDNVPKNNLLGRGNLNNVSPGILHRKPLSNPVRSGLVSLDTMIPVGKGQRELIIGDRNTGKTSIALSYLDTENNTKNIYVSIGQKNTSIIDVYSKIRDNGTLNDTIIIHANPESISEQYFAPKIAMAFAEVLSYQGENVVVILDDLTKHANIHREISLSIGRTPGREAYPTDIFYTHSQLLERAGSFKAEVGGGTITALPIVETVMGEVSSLIPSNVISITDGQIFTDSDKFQKGEFPAVDIGRSVSRTGSIVQSSFTKYISKGLKEEYAKLNSVKKFMDMSIDISDEVEENIKKLEGIETLLVQHGIKGYTEFEMFVLTYLYRTNKLHSIKDRIKFSNAFLSFVKTDSKAIKLREKFENDSYIQDPKSWALECTYTFINLIKIAQGDRSSIISEKEYTKYAEVSNDR